MQMTHEAALDAVTAHLSENLAIMNFLSMIRLFDKKTYHHSLNVAEYALSFGISLGLKFETLVELGIGALLHDFGKIFVDNTIINKPSKLSIDEFKLVKKHTNLGYESLSPQSLSLIATDIILHHHERYNGTGYPEGLRGNEISFYSKIVAVCDVYDALTSDRVYRDALSSKTALDYLTENAGTLFDPKITDSFAGCMKSGVKTPLMVS